MCVEASSCNVNPRTNMISEGRVGPQSGKGMIFFYRNIILLQSNFLNFFGQIWSKKRVLARKLQEEG